MLALQLLINAVRALPQLRLLVCRRGLRSETELDHEIASKHDTLNRKLAYGGVPETLIANGLTFDGNAVLSMEHMKDPRDPADVPYTFLLGAITSLSVASATGSQPEPSDRISVVFRQASAVGVPLFSSPSLLAVTTMALIAVAWSSLRNRRRVEPH